jgi:chorismate synthase
LNFATWFFSSFKSFTEAYSFKVVSINAFKGVSFGEGFKAAEKPGSEIQDEILYDND